MTFSNQEPGAPRAPLDPEVDAALRHFAADISALRSAMTDLDRRVVKRDSIAESETRKIAELAVAVQAAESTIRQLIDKRRVSDRAQALVIDELMRQSSQLDNLVNVVPSIAGQISQLHTAAELSVGRKAGAAVSAAVSTEFAQRDHQKRRRNALWAIVVTVVSAPTFVPKLFEYLDRAGAFLAAHWK